MIKYEPEAGREAGQEAECGPASPQIDRRCGFPTLRHTSRIGERDPIDIKCSIDAVTGVGRSDIRVTVDTAGILGSPTPISAMNP